MRRANAVLYAFLRKLISSFVMRRVSAALYAFWESQSLIGEIHQLAKRLINFLRT